MSYWARGKFFCSFFFFSLFLRQHFGSSQRAAHKDNTSFAVRRAVCSCSLLFQNIVSRRHLFKHSPSLEHHRSRWVTAHLCRFTFSFLSHPT
uniref:Putative secreted protein n=1 Tax=Ixodes ricinus TaxID=34613 RepID=A0A6B0UH24_IXORI